MAIKLNKEHPPPPPLAPSPKPPLSYIIIIIIIRRSAQNSSISENTFRSLTLRWFKDEVWTGNGGLRKSCSIYPVHFVLEEEGRLRVEHVFRFDTNVVKRLGDVIPSQPTAYL